MNYISPEDKHKMEAAKLRAELSMNDHSSINDVTATRVNRSVKFNASDGRTLDIGDDEDAA